MAAARAEEYGTITAEARALTGDASPRERRRLADKLRAELRRIDRRDYFPPAERNTAHAAVRALHEVHAHEAAGADNSTAGKETAR